MTGPRGGKTTVTGGGLRRVQLSLDDETIARLDAEAAHARAKGRSASRSQTIRRLVRLHLASVSQVVV